MLCPANPSKNEPPTTAIGVKLYKSLSSPITHNKSIISFGEIKCPVTSCIDGFYITIVLMKKLLLK